MGEELNSHESGSGFVGVGAGRALEEVEGHKGISTEGGEDTAPTAKGPRHKTRVVATAADLKIHATSFRV
jgi:hypothetical protein